MPTQVPTLADRLTAASRALSRRHKLQVRLGGNSSWPELPQATIGPSMESQAGFPYSSAARNSGDDVITLTMPGRRADDLRLIRGEADMASLALRHHKPAVHAEHRPSLLKAAAIYDALESM